MQGGQNGFAAAARHISLLALEAVVGIHRPPSVGSEGYLKQSVHSLRRLADAVLPPGKREQVDAAEETPSGERRCFAGQKPAVFVLQSTAFSKRTGKHPPIVVRIVAVDEHHLILPAHLIAELVEEGISPLPLGSLAYQRPTPRTVGIIHTYIVETIAPQVISGILPQRRFVGTVEEVIEPRHPHFQMTASVGNVPSRRLHHEGMPLGRFFRRAVQACLVDGSDFTVLHHAVQVAVRIEGRHPPTGNQADGSPYPSEIIVFVGRAVLAETFRTILRRSQREGLAQPESVAQHQPLPEADSVIAHSQRFQPAPPFQQKIE